MVTQGPSHSDQHSLGLSVALHLLPGAILLLGLLAIGPFFVAQGFPLLLALVVIEVLIVLPLMVGIILHASRQGAKHTEPRPAITYRERIQWPGFLLFSLGTLAWAILAFVALSPLADTIKTLAFPWIPQWFELSDYVVNPDEYRPGSVVATWLLALVVTSITVPIVEELYFRGYLLPRIDRYGAWAPLINGVLFSVYHLWSLWLAPTRIIALLPLIYIVWLKRCIYIAIAVHLTLNLVGDSLLTLPMVFG